MRRRLPPAPRSFQLQPWDWSFYSDAGAQGALRLRSGERGAVLRARPRAAGRRVLRRARSCTDSTFKERHDLPVYQPDVRVFEVFDADGKPLALFLADYFARDNKQGGAWMNDLRLAVGAAARQPVVANHLNIDKPQAGQPVLLTFDEVTTMFHEFGHALHGMLSNVRYPLLAGTAVPRDFVEYPSQYNEMWAREPDGRGALRAPLPDRCADAPGAARAGDGGAEVQRGLRDHRVPRGGAARSGLAPDHARRRRRRLPACRPSSRRRSRRAAWITRRCRRAITRPTSRTSSTSKLLGRLLRVPVERGAGARHRAVVPRARRPDARQRRVPARHVLSRGRSEDPQVLFRDFYGGAAGDWAAARVPRAERRYGAAAGASAVRPACAACGRWRR